MVDGAHLVLLRGGDVAGGRDSNSLPQHEKLKGGRGDADGDRGLLPGVLLLQRVPQI